MKQKILFIISFIILGFITLKIPFTNIIGSNKKFTLFDFIAPTAGSFVGTGIGVISIFIIGSINLLFQGLDSVDKSSIIRLFPVLFGVWFFSVSKKSTNLAKWILVIPLISIIAFNLHPVGRTVWFYSLYWFIPLLVWPMRNKFLFARALGTTFVIHSVGSTIWLWVFNLPASVWITLIPIVALERSIFALGISASYVLISNILAAFSRIKFLTKILSFD